MKARRKQYEDKSKPMNEKKYHSKQEFEKSEIKRLEKNIEKAKDMKEKYGDKPILGGILFLIYGKEVLSLYGGSKAELMSFQSAYTLHFAGVKYAIDTWLRYL